MPRGLRPAFISPAGSILQVKMRPIGVSPMIWRRVLVPIAWTLEELHGVIQAATGWEGLHLYEFRVRAARYGSPDLCAGTADVTLESLRFRRNAKITYTYDMGDWCEHEIRVEIGSRRRTAGATRAAWADKAPACQRTVAARRVTWLVARKP